MRKLLLALIFLGLGPVLAAAPNSPQVPVTLWAPPTTTTAGSVYYWNGSAWAEFIGNVSGTQCFQESSSGVPAWGTCGSGSSGITIGTTTISGGTSGDCLYDNAGVVGNQACGGGSGLTVGTTTITSGTSGDIEFNNAGILGEKGVTGTGNVMLASSPSASNPTFTGSVTATGLITNADLVNTTITVNGTSCVLGSTCSPTAANPNALTISSPLTGTSYNGSAAITIACATCGVTGSPLSQFATTTSAQLAGVISDETGTGALVFGTSPTLTTPALGTPASGVATNLTGLPLTTGVTGILPIANGGTATATPGLVAGTNVTITGSWPNQTINSSGASGIACTQTFTSTTAGGSDFTPTPGTSQALTATSCTLTTSAALTVYFDTGYQVPATYSLSGQVVTITGGIPATVRQVTLSVGGIGGGNVSSTGTPTANQIAQWTNSSTVQGANIASLLTAGTGISITGTTNATIACPTSSSSVSGCQKLGTSSSAAPSAPTGTTSSSGVMMGLGSSCAVTPSSTGRVKIEWFYNVFNTTAGDGSQVNLRYGTGTAPTNGAAATGTALPTTLVSISPTASGFISQTNGGIITGLTSGTTYWVDANLSIATGGTASMATINCTAQEF